MDEMLISRNGRPNDWFVLFICHCLTFLLQGSSAESDDSPQLGSDSLEEIPGSHLLWKIAPRPASSTQVFQHPEHTLADTFVHPSWCYYSLEAHSIWPGSVSFFFSAADVQFHIICHAAKWAGWRDQSCYSQDRLQTEAWYPRHGKWKHW